MSKKKILLSIGTQMLLLIVLATTAYGINNINGSEGYQVPAGTQKMKVTSIVGCQSVTNNGGSDIFVPTNSTNEWNAFINNAPSLGYVILGTCTTPATAPQNLTATAGDQKITLNWSAPADNGGAAVTGYKIYRGMNSGGETFLIQTGNVLSYIDTGLTSGTTYYYKISAITDTEGVQSSEVNAKTFQYTSVGIDCTTGNITGYPNQYATKDLAVRATISSLQSCLTRNNYVTPATLTYNSYNLCGAGRGSCRRVTTQIGGFGLSNPECTYSTGPRSYGTAHPYKTWTYINSNQIVQNQSTNAFTGTAKEYSYGDLSVYDQALGNKGDGCSGGIYPEQITYHTTVCNGQTSISYCSNSDVTIPTSSFK